ncbi:MAG: hypothetical protein KAS32_08605 [Candidatus Peribacteraceae bacterium]|nr:hypothetical protein [Candidatus Peribacteraceae bacterium]
MSDKQELKLTDTDGLILVICFVVLILNCCNDYARSGKIKRLQNEVDSLYDEELLRAEEQIIHNQYTIEQLKKVECTLERIYK